MASKEYCQTNAEQFLFGQRRCPSGCAKLTPPDESDGPGFPEVDATGDGKVLVYVVVDRGVDCRELLQTSHKLEPKHRPLPSSEQHALQEPAHPHLLTQHSIIIHHLDDSRSAPQHRQFLGRPCLKLPAVFHDRRTRCHAASFKTRRRAAGQQDRCDYLDRKPLIIPPPPSNPAPGSAWSRPAETVHRSDPRRSCAQ